MFFPRSSRPCLLALVLLFARIPAAGADAAPATDSTAAATTSTAESRREGAPRPHELPFDAGRRLSTAGLENVTVESGDSARIAYENRRYRHSAEALAVAREAVGTVPLVFERRLGLTVAAIRSGDDSFPDFHVAYPSDLRFPRAPRGPLVSRTFSRADLDVGPLVDYRIGQLFNPLEVRLELQPQLRLNPWPGALVRAGVLIPITNDYPAGDLDLGAGRFRPGRSSLDQFFWLPHLALGSFSGGYFGDDRYGISFGAARPLWDGSWLLDAEIDRTGYLAFADGGTLYSRLRVTSGFGGVAWRPGFADITVRGRLAQFLYGDRGAELEVRRRFDDLEVAYFAQRTEGIMTYGIRLGLPVPPRLRAAGVPIRIQPVERWSISFRDESSPIGTWLTGVADREDYLRQLDRPELEHALDRWRAALASGGREGPRGRPAPDEWVSVSGMTGFIDTPWAGVMRDRGLEAGYNQVPKRWTYDHRGTSDNQIFYATLGFLPHVETAIRWTRIPGYRSFEEIVPDSRLVDIDRMSSGRIELVPTRLNRPGLAAGIEDVQGTRRFHSTYGVAGIPFQYFHLEGRASVGYGFRAFDATRYVLDGTFGALELDPTATVRVQAEYDTEKWNLGLGVSPGFGFRIRAALLNLQSITLGAGWAHTL